MNDHHQEAFREEADELLADLESALLELEERPEDPDLIGRVFRALHTIKGLGAMCGFDAVSAFTHQVESVFDRVRGGEVPVGRELVTLSLAALDRIRTMLAAGEAQGSADEGENAAVIAALGALLPLPDDGGEASLPAPPSPGTPLDDFLGVLTEYELSRLRANFLQRKGLYALRAVFSLAALDAELAEVTARIKREGELLASVPDPVRAAPESIAFRLLFASARDPLALEESLGSMPERVAADGCFGIGAAGSAPPQPSEAREVTYRIRFRPGPDILTAGLDPFALFADLRRLGACRVMAQTGLIPPLAELEPSACFVSWDIVLTTRRGEAAIRDVFFFVGDEGELRIEIVDDGLGEAGGEEAGRLGEILVARGELSREELEKSLSRQKRIGEILVEEGIVHPGAVEAALIEQQHVQDLRRERQSRESAGSIRVPTEKLDLLVNLVGELVTVQARLGQAVSSAAGSELPAIAEEVERLAGELRDNALNIRMLPIGTTFGTFQRLVRDLSLELGKEAELVTAGAETELDKTVIEKMNEPLVHLIRNSIDHGIEPPGTREAAGKPRKGTVRLAAVHSGDSVVITIDDDGAGLDREAIRATAARKGLIPPSAELADKDVFALIFGPGFSTARTISSISGRGVGMDVVKRSIESLRGTIEISSRPGEGTTIVVRIPLTLAIVASLLVGIGRDRFVLPLALVEECIELTRADVARTHGRNLADVRGRIVPYISLREVFGMRDAPPEIQQIIITNLNGERVGFAVDYVVGEHQTVIKSLGRVYRDVPGVSGATILGDGSVALILDPPHLVRGAALQRS